MSTAHHEATGGVEVEVVTPTGVAVHSRAEEVTAPGLIGELGVLSGHLPLLSGLRPGIVRLHHGRSQELYLIGPGYLEVGPERVVILTSSCEPSTEDVAAEIASGARVLEGFPSGLDPAHLEDDERGVIADTELSDLEHGEHATDH
jgi:F-type H+-transporting ATPase subunit epsilon